MDSLARKIGTSRYVNYSLGRLLRLKIRRVSLRL